MGRLRTLSDVSSRRAASWARNARERIRARQKLTSLVAALTLTSGAGLLALSTAPGAGASTSTTGTGVSYTLEGCRGSVTSADYVAGATASYFPYGANAGTYICSQTSDYTTGNLGGGWNELDLVPGRVVVAAGNSAPTTQDFQFAVAVDNCSGSDGATGCTGAGDHPGYDQLSALTLNTSLDTGASAPASCGAISIVQRGFAPPDFSAVGGTGTSLYEILQVTGQAKNTTCDYDFDARLAFNSHLYPGSSLHYDLANAGLTTSGIGAKDVSIPVKEIQPIGFTKTQNSEQGASVTWNPTKSITGSPNFSNTCDVNEATTSNVSVTVNWTKNTTLGDTQVTADISITNDAHRPLNISVSDQLYDGASTSLATALALPADASPLVTNVGSVGAGDSTTVTDSWSTPAINAESNYSDVATGTVTDPTFGGGAVGHPQTWATSAVTSEGPSTGASAVVTDVEELTDGYSASATTFGSTLASDYAFKITAVNYNNTGTSSGTLYSTYDPVHPANDVAYTLGTYTQGPVTWVSPSQSASGTVTFSKVVEVLRPTQETATLGDVATVSPTGQTASSFYDQTEVRGGAQVSIVVSKATSVALDVPNTFYFYAYPAGTVPTNGASASDTPTPAPAGSTSVTIPAGQTGLPNGIDGTISGLDPGTQYYIDEPGVTPFPGQVVPADNDGSGGTSDGDPYGTNPDGDADDTGVSVSLPSCSTQVNVVNSAAPAKAQVEKITVPDPAPSGATSWTFTLTGVESDGTTAVSDLGGGSATSEQVTATANAGYVQFNSNLDQDGATYTITETEQTGWSLTSVAGDFGGTTGRVTPSTATATCKFTLDLTTDSGGLLECAFTNTQLSWVQVTKTLDGGSIGSNTFGFTLTGGPSSVNLNGTANAADSGVVKFGYDSVNDVGELLPSPSSYTLCETALPAGWSANWTANGVPVTPVTDPGTGNLCYTFNLPAGSLPFAFTVDNLTPPGGGQRTIGYWKNWSCEAPGNQSDRLSPLLPIQFGSHSDSSCTNVVTILSSPGAKYAENQLAAQLAGAELNVAAGASTCPAVTSDIAHANWLLTQIGYNPANAPTTLVGSKSSWRSDVLNTASELNDYNNGLLFLVC